MKKSAICIAAALCIFSSAYAADKAAGLPTASIAGQKYYVYEIRKGDSLYGIANKYGWNLDRLVKLNPSMQHKLQRGAKLYFPVDGAEAAPEASADFVPLESYPVIRHIVKKGDTVYSIARLYGVPVETVYEFNPSTKSVLKRGDAVVIPQHPDAINEGQNFYFYTIRPGDTLASIAEMYNTGVEQLLRDNKGVSDDNFQAGDMLRISVNSNKGNLITETVDETRISFADPYKAAKDDTWESVAQKTGVSVSELREANPRLDLKKNALVSVPIIETEQVLKEVEPADSRELSLEGRRDIYKEVHKIASADSPDSQSVNLAIIIEEPSSKRDNEFIRGAFLALDRFKNSSYPIKVKVLHDNNRTPSDSVASVQKLANALDQFDADVVVATYERNFPRWLAEYGEAHGTEVVNVFDVKSELYMDNPAIIHLLTPSSYFTEEVADWVSSSFPSYKLVMVGKTDPDDSFAEAILSGKSAESVMRVSIEDLPGLQLADDSRYLFYGFPQQKEEVASMLSAVEAIKDQYPLVYIKVLGRPSWITLAEGMKEQFSRADVFFPSRFFFDNNAAEGKKFIADYSAAYGHGPIRSFPTYAVAGYDMVNYFVSGVAKNDGDFNAWLPEVSELQTPVSLQRAGNWSGFFNPSAYIIRYSPFGHIEKILIKK